MALTVDTAKVVSIGTTNPTRSPLDVLEQTAREFPDMSDVYVLFYEKDGTLRSRSSHMTNQAALWMLAKMQQAVLDPE